MVKKIKARQIKPEVEIKEEPLIHDHHIPGKPWQMAQNYEKHFRKKQNEMLKQK